MRRKFLLILCLVVAAWLALTAFSLFAAFTGGGTGAGDVTTVPSR